MSTIDYPVSTNTGPRQRPPTRPSDNPRVQHPTEDAHADGLLMHNLTGVNTQLARYVLNYADADAGRTEPITPADELILAELLTGAAENIRARAARRTPALRQ